MSFLKYSMIKMIKKRRSNFLRTRYEWTKRKLFLNEHCDYTVMISIAGRSTSSQEKEKKKGKVFLEI